MINFAAVFFDTVKIPIKYFFLASVFNVFHLDDRSTVFAASLAFG